MLTDKDREWLEKREQITIANGLYFCAHCDMYSGDYSVFTGYCTAFEIDDCPMVSNFRDAAEFEAKVVAKFANYETLTPCFALNECFEPKLSCKVCQLKYNRLAVEAEMEQEGK